MSNLPDLTRVAMLDMTDTKPKKPWWEVASEWFGDTIICTAKALTSALEWLGDTVICTSQSLLAPSCRPRKLLDAAPAFGGRVAAASSSRERSVSR